MATVDFPANLEEAVIVLAARLSEEDKSKLLEMAKQGTLAGFTSPTAWESEIA